MRLIWLLHQRAATLESEGTFDSSSPEQKATLMLQIAYAAFLDALCKV